MVNRFWEVQTSWHQVTTDNPQRDLGALLQVVFAHDHHFSLVIYFDNSVWELIKQLSWSFAWLFNGDSSNSSHSPGGVSRQWVGIPDRSVDESSLSISLAHPDLAITRSRECARLCCMLWRNRGEELMEKFLRWKRFTFPTIHVWYISLPFTITYHKNQLQL